MNILKSLIFLLLLNFIIFFLNLRCSKSDGKTVVLYTSLDHEFSQPIVNVFEEKTGIKVKAIYDTESTKTTGLVNRLIAEKNYPQADVFWNNEIVQTIVLKKKGILQSYISSSAYDIPQQFKDPDGYWVGFAARARVLIYNTNIVSYQEAPKSIFDLTNPKWKHKVALANPLFGTTATHMAALFYLLGEEKAKAYIEELIKNEIVIVAGNATSRDQVADGELSIGFTDTDDANSAIQDGKPVGIIFPDEEGIGTLIIPNTISLIANCSHPKEGKKLIDFILTPEVEKLLANSRSVQMPLRSYIPTPPNVPSISSIKAMDVDFEKIADVMEISSNYLQQKFMR